MLAECQAVIDRLLATYGTRASKSSVASFPGPESLANEQGGYKTEEPELADLMSVSVMFRRRNGSCREQRRAGYVRARVRFGGVVAGRVVDVPR